MPSRATPRDLQNSSAKRIPKFQSSTCVPILTNAVAASGSAASLHPRWCPLGRYRRKFTPKVVCPRYSFTLLFVSHPIRSHQQLTPPVRYFPLSVPKVLPKARFTLLNLPLYRRRACPERSRMGRIYPVRAFIEAS